MHSGLARFGVSVEAALLEKFDSVIAQKGYTNRSEAIRDLMREYLIEQEWTNSEAVTMGTITLVYDHSAGELVHKLTSIQHDYHETVISSLHVHLDEHNCMEVLAVKGKSADIETIANRLISTRGVKHGKLVMTSSGKGL